MGIYVRSLSITISAAAWTTPLRLQCHSTSSAGVHLITRAARRTAISCAGNRRSVFCVLRELGAVRCLPIVTVRSARHNAGLLAILLSRTPQDPQLRFILSSITEGGAASGGAHRIVTG